jgi:hypothetical protein
VPIIISETPNMVDTDRFQPTHKPVSPSAPSRGSSCITMSAHPSLDRESFQTLLASAFAVQESGMNQQSLSVLVELQKAITKDELPFDKILDLIADRARIVADASGIAIGLLTGNQLVYRAGSGSGTQLVYRAGSGSGTQYIGQRVTAVLSVSAHTGPRKEILRVANAESDFRIEAAICRERDAKALLIMPIYRDCFVAGLLETLFSDAHTFGDREVCTYRMLANLVEEAMARDLQLSQDSAPTTQPTPLQPSVGKTPSLNQRFRSDDGTTTNPSAAQFCGAPATVIAKISTPRPPAEAVTTIKWPLKRAFFRDYRWSFGAATVVILLGVVWWISLYRRAAFTMEGESEMMRSKAAEKQVPKPTAAKWLNEASGTQYTNAARRGFTKVRVGPNEVDYIAEDVTIRHFKKPVPSSHASSVYKQFDIGDDVTVRIFNHKAPGLPANSLPQDRRYP